MKKPVLLLALASLVHAAPTTPKENAVTESFRPKTDRIGPPAVTPLKHDGIRYEAVHWGRSRGLPQNGGYIEAFDASSGKSLWLAQVYAITYLPGLETDVQDIFISKIEAGTPGQLLITDERGRQYVFDLARHTSAGQADAPTGKLMASRLPPPRVPPLDRQGVRYSPGFTGPRGKEPGGWVQAVDIASGQQLWQVQVYTVTYQPNLETDVQDRYIRSLRLTEDQLALEIENEAGWCYRLDLASRQVRLLGGPPDKAGLADMFEPPAH